MQKKMLLIQFHFTLRISYSDEKNNIFMSFSLIRPGELLTAKAIPIKMPLFI